MESRELPRNLDLEEALLGSCVIDPDALAQISFLRSEDFWVYKHRMIYEAMLDTPVVDYLTLCDKLEQRGTLQEVGGAAYISTLVNVVPSALHVVTYADTLVDLALKRGVIRSASEAVKAAYTETPAEEVIADAGRAITGLIRQRGDFRSAAELTDEHTARVDEWAANPVADGVRGIRTGLTDLDRVIGGLEPQMLIVLGSRPRVGKTALMANIAVRVARQGIGVMFVSLEMSASQLIGRMAGGVSRVPTRAIKSGNVEPGVRARYDAALDALHNLDGLYISDTTSLTTQAVRAAALALGYPPLVLVDHIRLVADKHDREVQRLGMITWGLKQLAKEGHCTVVAAAQLNRALEHRADKRPTLADLRDSGEIEENADIVLGLHREPETIDRTLEIRPLKNREGPTNTLVRLFFNPATMQIEDSAPLEMKDD